ncbi:fimbrial protein [Erwinia sp. BNK-24-b]|uniref:fimbrial protein n=1 Tax=Erwinia TaxID=551 RepID=UPI001FEDA373|nr:fimbrial protein [Erwinia phyllosphaerae]MBV4367240.1 type 1 fimbrial protein [Erwinia phyllosphaerae]
MKKLAIAAAVVTAFIGMNTQATSTGTITFNGELTATSCNVLIDGVQNPTIKLPTAGIGDLATAGTTAGETAFAMDLTDCKGTLKTVAAFFSAGPTVNSNGRLDNQTTEGATNVSLQLVEPHNNNAVIAIGQQSQSNNTFATYDTDGKATLYYAVRYYAEGTTTAGLVSSNVVYGLQYK